MKNEIEQDLKKLRKLSTWKRFLTILSPLHLAVIVTIIALGWFTFFGDSGLFAHRNLSNENTELKNEVGNIKRQIDQLKSEKELLLDPVYLERIIRTELGYVKPGEVIFHLAN